VAENADELFDSHPPAAPRVAEELRKRAENRCSGQARAEFRLPNRRTKFGAQRRCLHRAASSYLAAQRRKQVAGVRQPPETRHKNSVKPRSGDIGSHVCPFVRFAATPKSRSFPQLTH